MRKYDPRAEHYDIQNKIHDTQFTEPTPVWAKLYQPQGKMFSQKQVREIYLEALKVGFQDGLEAGSYEGQIIDIRANMDNTRHEEFYAKFLRICKEYDCAIEFHPRDGMKVTDLNLNQDGR